MNEDLLVARPRNAQFRAEIWRDGDALEQEHGGYYALVGKPGADLSLIHKKPVRTFNQCLADVVAKFQALASGRKVRRQSQSTTTGERLVYRLHELASATGLSVQLLRKSIREGKLKAKKIGGVVIVARPDALNFLEGANEPCP